MSTNNIEEYTRSYIDSGTPEFTFSLICRKFRVIDGIETQFGDDHKIAVVPGDFELVKKSAPNLFPIFEAIWTQDVIDAWNNKCK